MGRERDKNWSFVQCSAEVINWGLIQEKFSSFEVHSDKITTDGLEQEKLQPGRTWDELWGGSSQPAPRPSQIFPELGIFCLTLRSGTSVPVSAPCGCWRAGSAGMGLSKGCKL